VDADAGVDVRIANRQIDAGTGTLQVATDRQNVFDAMLSGAGQDIVEVGLKWLRIEMGMGINEG
jgi:hypothetical protein